MKKILLALVVLIIAGSAVYFISSKTSSNPGSPSPASVETPADNAVVWKPAGSNPYMLLKNVKFRYTDDVFVNIHDLLGQSEPNKPNKYVDMNDVTTFTIHVLSAQCSLVPEVMGTLFNKYVLNYEGAPLKDMKISIVETEIDGQKVPMLKTSGKMKMVVWVPFEMISRIGVDKATNCMTIDAEKVSSMGFPYLKKIMDVSPIKLENLLSIAPGRGLFIKGNTLYVEAVNITPPPKMRGNILDVKINAKNNCVDLKIGDVNAPKVEYTLLVPDAKNYMYIFKGDVIFGKNLSSDGRLQLIDTDPSDYLDYYLRKYLKQMEKGVIHMKEDASLVVDIGDYE